MAKEVVLTGLRTNAEYHLGNYLGAILPMVERSNNLAGKYQINLFAPDLHSFTTPIDHTKLYAQTMHNIKLFIAAGLPINNPDVYIYRQSFIPAHSEMTVILNNFAYFGELGRMTQFKEKAGQPLGLDNHITSGLFTYPVLMAADILLYGAKWVPVGDDQTQHLEFTRNLAQRLNNKFGDLFVVPESVEKQHDFVGKSQGTRIRSLRNPENKMSKSINDPAGTILLSDRPEEAVKKIMSATTDSFGEIKFNFIERPGISNLLQILALLTGESQNEINTRWEGKSSYGELKTEVASRVSDLLADMQKKFDEVSDETVNNKLMSSEEAMSIVARQTLVRVQQAVGLRSL